MANLIQIKRANTSTAPATLNQGEMAYTANGGVLFIGDPSTSAVTAIGGVRNPGTLTANQALVANSTSGIDRVITGNLTVRSITANGVYSPGAGYLLSVDGGGNTYWLPQSAVTVNTAAQWTWTNTHTFTVGIAIGNSAILNISNSNIQYVGNNTTLPTVTIANTGVIQSGNSTITGAPQVIVANSTGTSTINAASISTTTLYGTTLFANVSASYANISGQVNTGTLYVTTSANIASATIANATGVYTTGTVNGAVLSVGTSFVANPSTLSAVSNALFVNSTSVVFTSGVTTVNAYSANVYAQNLTVSGYLVVSGTVMTINTQTLTVNDNIIELGLNNTMTDAVDTGWFSPAGNSTSVWYSGFARIATKSSNNNPWFWIFGSNTNPNTATTVDTSANSVTGTIQAYLVPYGSQTGAFVVNTQSVAITANSTVNVNISANTLTLTTGLGATSGGTGRTTGFTAGDLLYASNTTYMSNLAIGVTGQVLQVSVGNLPSWGTLDGGTF